MWIQDVALEAWRVLVGSAVFVLFGFGIAAVLYVFLAEGRAVKYLQSLGSRSVFLASLVGLPLPLCSCSVLPAAVALRKRGASKGATLSFLISTPETSVTSVLLTYGLLGPVMAIFRPVASFCSAVVAGLLDNFVEKRSPSQVSEVGTGEDSSCCAQGQEQQADATKAAESRPSLTKGLRFAFVDVFDDIIGWLIIGVLAAALLNVLVPPAVMSTVFGGTWRSMLIMLVLGVPLYVCAEASTPIAAAFVTGGVSPGAALVFLLVGPATNLGSVGVLSKLLGRRTVVIYLVSISVVALLMGWLLDVVLAGRGIDLAERSLSEPFVPQSVKVLGAAVFVMLTVVSLGRLRYADRALGWLDAHLPMRVTRATAGAAVGILAVAGYAASGLFMVGPGELGFAKRFGQVVRRDLPPGLHYAWPYPIGQGDRLAVGEVRRLELGYLRRADSTPTLAGARPVETADNPRESWMLLADENVVSVKSVVHYGVRPGGASDYLYANRDVQDLVRNVTLSVLRQVLATQVVETVMTVERSQIEQTITERIRARLEACDTGVLCYTFRFLDVHAPESVHPAFRDVASAMEDKATRINRAETFEAKTIPLARGQAAEAAEEAGGYAGRTIDQSRGRARRFVLRQEQYVKARELTRARLYFETIDSVLPRISKYIKPPASAGSGLEIWFTNSGRPEDLPFSPPPQQPPGGPGAGPPNRPER